MRMKFFAFGVFVSSLASATEAVTYDSLADGLFIIDANSGNTINLRAPSLTSTSSYYLIFPSGDGAADQVLSTDGAGTMSWRDVSTLSNAIVANTGNSNVTLSGLDNERIFTFTPTSSINVTLDDDYKSGQILTFVNNGTAIVKLLSDNSSTIRQVYPGTSAQVFALQNTPTTSAHWEGVGTVTSNWIVTTSIAPVNTDGEANSKFMYKRIGDTLHVKGSFQMGANVSAIAAKPAIQISLSGVAIDSTPLTTQLQVQTVGMWAQTATGGDAEIGETKQGPLVYDDISTDRVYITRLTNNNRFEFSNAQDILQNSKFMSVEFDVPISGWTDKKG